MSSDNGSVRVTLSGKSDEEGVPHELQAVIVGGATVADLEEFTVVLHALGVTPGAIVTSHGHPVTHLRVTW